MNGSQDFHKHYVALLCDADKRTSSRPTAHVASVVSVHALADAHQYYAQHQQRWLRRYVLRSLRSQAVAL